MELVEVQQMVEVLEGMELIVIILVVMVMVMVEEVGLILV